MLTGLCPTFEFHNTVADLLVRSLDQGQDIRNQRGQRLPIAKAPHRMSLVSNVGANVRPIVDVDSLSLLVSLLCRRACQFSLFPAHEPLHLFLFSCCCLRHPWMLWSSFQQAWSRLSTESDYQGLVARAFQRGRQTVFVGFWTTVGDIASGCPCVGKPHHCLGCTCECFESCAGSHPRASIDRLGVDLQFLEIDSLHFEQEPDTQDQGCQQLNHPLRRPLVQHSKGVNS